MENALTDPCRETQPVGTRELRPSQAAAPHKLGGRRCSGLSRARGGGGGVRQEAGGSGQHPGGRRLGDPTQRLPPALTSRKIDMPLDSCRAELSSSEELPEDGGVPRASSVLPGAPSILAALPPSPVCGCGPLAERRSRLRARCPRPSSRPALQAPRLAPAPASLGLRVRLPDPRPRALTRAPLARAPSQRSAARCAPHREQIGPAWPDMTARPLPIHDSPTCLEGGGGTDRGGQMEEGLSRAAKTLSENAPSLKAKLA